MLERLAEYAGGHLDTSSIADTPTPSNQNKKMADATSASATAATISPKGRLLQWTTKSQKGKQRNL